MGASWCEYSVIKKKKLKKCMRKELKRNENIPLRLLFGVRVSDGEKQRIHFEQERENFMCLDI